MVWLGSPCWTARTEHVHRRGKHYWAVPVQKSSLGLLYVTLKQANEFQDFKSGPSVDL